MNLAEWHARLSRHFDELARRRASSGWPVFALEHGLTAVEVQELERAIRIALASGEPSKKVELAWIVYAAEFGYGYAGDEYWQSFGIETRGWNDRWRGFIRDAFKRFAKRYNGATPEGPWAETFRIIAWPITHGLLPKDLQKQLARVLYDARYTLRPEHFSSAASLGEHLRSLSYDSSSRFREFAENTLLLGQIAAALLLQQPGDEQLISAATLERLVNDINDERAAREWLKEARSSAQRLRVRGLSTRDAPSAGNGNTTQAPSGSATQDRVAHVRGLGIEPSLLLRPASAGTWDVMLELPDFTPLLRFAPHLRQTLTQSRARVVGAAAGIVARGRLLNGGLQRFSLNDWPDADKVLLAFDIAPPELRLLLETSFRMPTGDSWLFRVSGDGQARALRSRVVHPGESYVLLQKAAITGNPIAGFRKVDLNCKGVHGLAFTVPERVDDLWEVFLKNLKLDCSKTLRVWPAGTVPALWDDAGTAEWILGTEIIVGVEVDHSVQSLEITLDQGVPRTLGTAAATGGQVFISLGCPEEGVHALALATTRVDGRADELRGHLRYRVRPPRQVSVGRSEQFALLLATSPNSPSLEDVWDNRVELQVVGPAATEVNCSVVLTNRVGDKTLYRKTLPALALPIEPETWRKWFQQNVQKDKDADLQYDAAFRCEIGFNAGTTGCVSLVCDREFTPLRWTAESKSGTTKVRLLDDTGAEAVVVNRRPLVSPSTETTVAYETATAGLPLSFPGALLVARSGGISASALVVPSKAHLQLSELKINPTVVAPVREERALDAFIAAAVDWENARVKGSALALQYRQQIIQSFLVTLATTICGDRWARLERRHREGDPTAIREMVGAISDSADERLVGPAIANAIDRLMAEHPDRRPAYLAQLVAGPLKLAAARGSESGPTSGRARPPGSGIAGQPAAELCSLALRAASSPAAFRLAAGMNSVQAIRRLLDRPVLMRAARLAVLHSDALSHGGKADSGVNYAGWTW